MSFSVCLVEPDVPSAKRLGRVLAGAGYRVGHDRTLGRFLDRMARKRPDVVLMDLHLPGMEGREIVRALRGDPVNARLIIVGFSGRAVPGEATAVFQAGADEYFERPFDEPLLLARLRSLLQRAGKPEPAPALKHGPLVIEPDSRVCRAGGKVLSLTRLEFDILLRFVQNPNRVLTRGHLIDSIWGCGEKQGERAVDRHVYSLRGKLGMSGRNIKTIVGIGYCLEDAKVGALSGSSK